MSAASNAMVAGPNKFFSVLTGAILRTAKLIISGTITTLVTKALTDHIISCSAANTRESVTKMDTRTSDWTA